LNTVGKTEIDFYLHGAKKIHPELIKFLYYHNFENDMNSIIKNSKTEDQLKQQKLKWFDGFMTLKLIHHLRDNGLPEKNMFDVLDEIFSWINIPWIPERDKAKLPDLNIRRDYLDILRQYA
jgi:Mg2+/citrate symporter